MYSFIVRKRKKKRCNVKASSQVDWLEVFQIDSRRTRENFELQFSCVSVEEIVVKSLCPSIIIRYSASLWQKAYM